MQTGLIIDAIDSIDTIDAIDIIKPLILLIPLNHWHKLVDELNPSHWVGQVVKTIEIIGKTN